MAGDYSGVLTATTFGRKYYEEHANAGLDYLAYGEWHKAYGRMITESCLQLDFSSPSVLDAGCACGAQLMGFKETGAYAKVYGIDAAEHMVNLGRQAFGFTAQELMAGSIDRLPIPDGALTLINSGQVLEHVPDHIVDRAFAEFFRVLAPGGRMFHNLASLKRFNAPDDYFGDPTHINVKPNEYWAVKFHKAGFVSDFESYDRFVRSRECPGTGFPNFFNSYPVWTSFALMKPTNARRRSFWRR